MNARLQLLPLVLLSLLAVLILDGCSSKRETAVEQKRESRTSTTQKTCVVDPETSMLALSGLVTTETAVFEGTLTESDEETRLVLPSTESLATVAKASIGVAANVAGGNWLGAIEKVVGLGLIAWAAHKTAESKQRDEQNKYLKADVDEGYKQAEVAKAEALRLAKLLPPSTDGLHG